jgi:MFS family permease
MSDPHPGGRGPATSAHAKLVLLVVCVGTMLGAMAGSMVNLTLPSIGRELEISIDSSRWVVQAFLMVNALLLLPAGRLGDSIGHGRVYLSGFALFGVMSLVCGLADSFWVLLAGRVLQGVGAALLMATGPALLTTTFPPAQRGRALGLLASATYLGLTIGPPLAGALISGLGWRWTFYFNVPIAITVVLLGLARLPRDRGQEARGRRGGVLSAMLGLFRSWTFNGAVLSALTNYVALFAVILLVPFYLEEGLGLAPSRVGLYLAVQPLAMALVASPSGWLSDRIGSRGLATGGMLALAIGLVGASTLDAGSDTVTAIGWLALIGLGTGVFISPNSSALMGSAPRAQQGIAGSLMAEARIVGMLLGVTLASALFDYAGGRTGAAWRPQEFNAFELALRAAAGVALFGALAAALRGRSAGSNAPGHELNR